MGALPATKCRYCGDGGELVKGAHLPCRNDAYRAKLRERKGITPDRYKHEVDRPTVCQTCGKNPRWGKSRNCEACRERRKLAIKRESTNKYKRMVRERDRLLDPPRLCPCGCKRTVPDRRRTYATPQCRPEHNPKRAKAPEHRQAPKQFRQKPLDGSLRRGKGQAPGFRPGNYQDAAPVETIITPPGIVTRVIPSLMPSLKCEITGTLRDVCTCGGRSCWGG